MILVPSALLSLLLVREARYSHEGRDSLGAKSLKNKPKPVRPTSSMRRIGENHPFQTHQTDRRELMSTINYTEIMRIKSPERLTGKGTKRKKERKKERKK
jgi:hypothetical protein